MSEGAEGTRRRTLAEWQEMLDATFFSPSPERAPIIFFLDDEEMERLWPDVPSPVDDLAGAVRGQLHLEHANPFELVERDLSTWRRGSQSRPPGCLPLLALTVVAATHMRNDGVANSSAYYLRLAQLLWRSGDSVSQPVLQSHVTTGFPVVVDCWRALDGWIRSTVRDLGDSTIQMDPILTRIGYPMSQALIRGSDRDRLSSFFEILSRSHPSSITEDALLSAIAIWNLRPRGFSSMFSHALINPAEVPGFARALCALFASWNGQVVEGYGRRTLLVRLQVDLDAWTFKPVIRLVDGIDEDTYDLPSGGEASIRPPRYGNYYSADEELFLNRSIEDTFRYRGRHTTLVQEHRRVWVLRTDLSNGRWVSERSLIPYREHLLLVHASLTTEFSRALGLVADDGWVLLRQNTPLVAGFAIFTGVTLSDPQRLESAGDEVPLEIRQILRPETPPVPTIVDGLPIARDLGRNHFLLGGAPALLLPVGAESRIVEASLDGVTQVPPFRATGFPIPLQELQLDAGAHEIIADGVHLSFSLHKVDPSAAVSARQLDDLANTENNVDEDMSEIFLRRSEGVAHWLIRPDGTAERVAPSKTPDWMKVRGLPSAYYERVGGDFAWHLIERNGVFAKPEILKPLGAVRLDRDRVSSEFWRRVLQQDWGAQPEWARLLNATVMTAWAQSR